MSPKVSIVIPVYNGADYLAEAVDSALAQSYPNLEIIVVNDGSTDGGETEAIALRYADRIRYVAKPNGGVASALNRGIQAMTGDYLSWLSHDDVYRPEKIAMQVAELDRLGREVVLHTDYEIIDGSGRLRSVERVPRFDPAAFRYRLTVSYPIHGCTALVPRAVLERCGLFNEALRTAQDYDLWFRMAEYVSFIHMPVALIKARTHERQGTRTMLDVVLRECDTLLQRFVLDLREHEIIAGSGQPLWRGYLTIASSPEARSYLKAAATARELATQHRPSGLGWLPELLPIVAQRSRAGLRRAAGSLLRRLSGR